MPNPPPRPWYRSLLRAFRWTKHEGNKRRPRLARPRLEELEDRLAPSVTNLNPTINVSNATGPQSEASIAVNPTNPLNLVAVANDINNVTSLNTYTSTDGGATWTTHVIDDTVDGLPAGDFRFDPNVAFDSDGNAYVVYSTGLTASAESRVVLARSDDGGDTFGQITTVTTDATADIVLHTASLTTRANGSGADSVLVVWARVVSGLEKIQAALSTDAGATFNVTNNQINDIDQRTFLPWAAVDGAGDFHVIWEVNDSSGTGFIFHDVLDGTTLASGTDVTVTTINITDFAEATSKIPAQPDRGIFSVGTIDIDRTGGTNDGRIYVSYTDRASTATNDTNIFVRFSDGGGADTTWSSPVQVN